MEVKDIGSQIADLCAKDMQQWVNVIEQKLNPKLDSKVKQRINNETAILVHAATRIALQSFGKMENPLKKRIVSAFDETMVNKYMREEFTSIAHHRGKQYFEIFSSYYEDIIKKNWKNFLFALSTQYVQACKGEGKEGDAIILGNFFEDLPLRKLASDIWVKTFTNTINILEKEIENKKQSFWERLKWWG